MIVLAFVAARMHTHTWQSFTYLAPRCTVLSNLQVARTRQFCWQIVQREAITDGSIFQYWDGQSARKEGRERQQRGVGEHFGLSVAVRLYYVWNKMGNLVKLAQGIAVLSLDSRRLPRLLSCTRTQQLIL